MCLAVLTYKVTGKLSDTLKVSDSYFFAITFCVITFSSYHETHEIHEKIKTFRQMIEELPIFSCISCVPW
ncbi:hypothetical protein U14_05387 [Candidatus Moduliflexus flocculans]|uniref:Uncharacterized protein n=1 Tax=Candidatus Moduliflexus flocculans TaxID=1499966 RepID=A0A081BRS8_9BACT|nr:hypothetical protein U14_05387 [Candidatus Moduliflexus flocculans]